MTWILIPAILIMMATALLPFVIKAVLNNVLRKMDGYTGQIDRLRINLFRSKISLQSVRITTEDDPAPDDPLLLVPTITICFKWKQLLRKRLDLNIVVHKPQLHFIAEKDLSSKDGALNNSHDLPGLKNAIEKLISFRISVDVRDGKVRYVNSHSNPQLDIAATEMNLTIRDFTNRALLSKTCSIVGTCCLYDGTTIINATLLPLEPTLTFDLNLELKSINLVLLNDLFRAYGKVDINKGTLNLYAEVAVADNSFKGYIKPLIKDLDFISAADREDNIFQRIWERIVAGFYNVIENDRDDQVATKIPIEGRLDDPHVRLGVAILGVLRNAFVKALAPALDNTISMKSVWNRARSATKGMVKAIFRK